MRAIFVGAAFAATIFLSAPVHADAPLFGSAVSIRIDNSGCNTTSAGFINNSVCFFALSQSTTASGFLSDPNSAGSASANLGSGAVSVGASGTNYANAAAIIWDTVTFSGAASGAVATLTMTGSAGLSGAAYARAGALIVDQALYPTSPYYVLQGNSVGDVNGTYTVQDTATIYNGYPYLVLIGVNAIGGTSGSGLFGAAYVTDPFSLQLPAGVTATFASGSTEFSSAVPETSTWAMLLLGFAGLGFLGYRRTTNRLPGAAA